MSTNTGSQLNMLGFNVDPSVQPPEKKKHRSDSETRTFHKKKKSKLSLNQNNLQVLYNSEANGNRQKKMYRYIMATTQSL